MSVTEILELVMLGVAIVSLVASIVTSIAKGKLKDFIIQKMEEAEEKYDNGKDKLDYVIKAVKEEYKLASLILNIRAFIEKIIGLSKKINNK